MKVVHYILGFVFAFAFLVIVIISSFELAVYSDFAWYEKEYRKYDVLTELEMDMPEVTKVTKEMLSYLRGDRGDLVVNTVVNGLRREFFNDREKAHMADVKNLFIGGLTIRRNAVIVCALAIGLLVLTKGNLMKVVPRSFFVCTGIFFVATISFGLLLVGNFDKYFTLFHELFFDNDLWLLDPYTDLLIRMLPEGLFYDMVARIGVIFVMTLVILLGVNMVILKLSIGAEKKLQCNADV